MKKEYVDFDNDEFENELFRMKQRERRKNTITVFFTTLTIMSLLYGLEFISTYLLSN